MSQDPIERRMEFIIEQQAQFSADLIALQAEMKEFREGMLELKRQQAQTTANVGQLADALLSLTRIVEEHGNQIAALSKVGKETDARLNTLITVVERHISGHGGGDGA